MAPRRRPAESFGPLALPCDACDAEREKVVVVDRLVGREDAPGAEILPMVLGTSRRDV